MNISWTWIKEPNMVNSVRRRAKTNRHFCRGKHLFHSEKCSSSYKNQMKASNWSKRHWIDHNCDKGPRKCYMESVH